jgi:hypothetical protein
MKWIEGTPLYIKGRPKSTEESFWGKDLRRERWACPA